MKHVEINLRNVTTEMHYIRNAKNQGVNPGALGLALEFAHLVESRFKNGDSAPLLLASLALPVDLRQFLLLASKCAEQISERSRRCFFFDRFCFYCFPCRRDTRS